MIPEVEKAILESLQSGLAEVVPSGDISIGEPGTTKMLSLSLLNTDFTVEEQGIGGSGSVKREEITETFPSDGKRTDFTLSQKPLQSHMSVQSPAGTEKNEPDDYVVDYRNDLISFREPPEKGTVQVQYCIARAVAETRNLKFILNYSLTVWAEDPAKRDHITAEIIRILFQAQPELEKRGVSEIRLIKGYLSAGQSKTSRILEYRVETTIQIEMLLPSMEQIEIGRKGE